MAGVHGKLGGAKRPSGAQKTRLPGKQCSVGTVLSAHAQGTHALACPPRNRRLLLGSPPEATRAGKGTEAAVVTARRGPSSAEPSTDLTPLQDRIREPYWVSPGRV